MYRYEKERESIFTERGFDMLQQITVNANEMVSNTGSAMMGNIIKGTCGDTWQMMACVDFMVEQGRLTEVTNGCAGQYRTFIAGPNFKG